MGVKVGRDRLSWEERQGSIKCFIHIFSGPGMGSLHRAGVAAAGGGDAGVEGRSEWGLNPFAQLMQLGTQTSAPRGAFS